MPRIIQVVLLVFEMIALSFLFSRISGIKLTWIKYVLIPFIYIFFNLLLFVLFSETFLTYLDLPVYFLTFSLLLTRQSSIPIMLSIFYGLFPIVLWNLLYRILTFFVIPIFGLEYNQLINEEQLILNITAFVASLLSLWIPSLLHYKFKRLRKFRLNEADKHLVIFLNISMIFYIVFVQFFSYLEITHNVVNLSYRKLIVIIYIILFLSSVNILDRNLRERIQQQLSEQRELQLRNMSDYSQHIEELYNELRSFRHDYINILRSLKLGIDTHDLPAIEQIYNQVIKDSGQALNQSKYDLGRLSNIHNDALKSVLSAKFLEAQSKGIEIGLEVPQEIKPQGMELLDFITIVSILADNAIEAAVETSHPVVSFAFLEQENRQIFIVENTIKEPSISSDNIFKKGFSTKGENRGLGLSNVQNIISHYPNVSLRTISHDHSFRQELEIK